MTSAHPPAYPNAHYLAEPDWMHAHIDDEDVRVVDARFDVHARADGTFEEVSAAPIIWQGIFRGRCS